jgi:hypothetical protein
MVADNISSTVGERPANTLLSQDARYAQFGIEIRSLKNALEHLEDRLSNADHEYGEQLVQRRGTALCDPKDGGLEAERRKIVGDFRTTLGECERILAEHSSYLRNPSTFGQNVLWEFKIQAKIDKLINRVQFHISKISLVTEQLQYGLLRDMVATLEHIGRNVADIHNVVVTGLLQPARPAATSIPEALAVRFNDALMAPNRPQSFEDPLHVPIQEGFDALAYHFYQSTVRSHGPPGSAQPLEQYINLLKARWLLQVIKRTTQFEDSFYYKRATLRIQQLVEDESHRPDLTQYSEPDFDMVNSASYAIWVTGDVDPGPSVEEGPGCEEQILELPMRDVPETLAIFRVSDTELRLVRSIVSSSTGPPPRDRETEVNIHLHQFEPVYACPWSSEPTFRVRISSNQAGNTRLYDFKEISHVLEFQRAVTGFKVVHDRENVQWLLDKKIDKKKRSGRARIQIWQYKPLFQATASRPQSSPSSPGDSPTNIGPPAPTSQTLGESMTKGLNPSIFSIVRNPAAGNGAGRENIILERVPLPVLVVFTSLERQRRFLSLERKWPALRQPSVANLKMTLVERGVKINPESCECRYTRNTCHQIIIENWPGSKSSFRLGILSETHGASTPQPWDLSVLGLPKHPLFSDRVKSLKVTYLALTFSTIQEKDKFVTAFDTISRLRYRDEQDYLEAKTRFARRANQPNAGEPARRVSAVNPLSRASTAPSLGSISFEQELENGVAY